MSKFDWTIFGEKWREMGLTIFGLLRKGTRTFHIRQNQPFLEVLCPLDRYNNPWKKTTRKNKETNKQASMIFFLVKNAKFHIFADMSLKLHKINLKNE
jgi:hypothetical protein